LTDPLQQAVDALSECGGNKGQAARLLGIARSTLRDRLDQSARLNRVPVEIPKPTKTAKHEVPTVHGQIAERASRQFKRSGYRVFILTSAQNNTLLHGEFWRNLKAYADFRGAEILVSRYSYNKKRYAGKAKPGSEKPSDFDGLWYAPEIENYVCDESIKLGKDLVWCGELNILPTAAKPLTGFDSYTGQASSVIPHAKIAKKSVPTGKYERTKFLFTTGTVTQRNYIATKAGQIADFHHAYGALIVEFDEQERWFARQINATNDGSFYDRTYFVRDGSVTDEHRVKGINWGDIHTAQLDPIVRQAAWGAGGMLDVLRPEYQFFNDLLDFLNRNHHNVGNPHVGFERFIKGQESVEEEVKSCSDFLRDARREWCESIVVDSNHDRAMERWLREADYKNDAVNAVFFLEAQLEKYRSIQSEKHKAFHLVEWAMRRAGCAESDRFLREDESFVLCPEHGGGIECGMHGDLGVNGSKGGPLQFTRMGRKANTNHTHTDGINDGVYTAGDLGKQDKGYNRGPNSHSQSNVVTYANGKRAIYTMWDGRWCAEQPATEVSLAA